MADDAVIARARAHLGVPFRLHGRDPATGLDCVGLVASATGVQAGIPTGYALRGGCSGRISAMIDGFAARRWGAMQPGDAVLMAVGHAQFHLGIWSGESLIHAHAGLRRVVETPGGPEGAVIAAWRPMKDHA